MHRVDGLRQAYRALHASEESGDLLALAFEGGLRLQVFSARCGGGVRARVEHALRIIGSLRTRGRRAAFSAELEASRVLEATPRASDADRRSALAGEAHLIGILKSTADALHARPQLFTTALPGAPSRPSGRPCRTPR